MVIKKDEFETEEDQYGTTSNADGSFTLDFFDSDELTQIDLGKIGSASVVRYITYVSISLPRKWVWTKPCKSRISSLIAAENMVCSRLLQEMGFNPKDWNRFNGFTHDIRSEWPELVNDSRGFIGETREVIVAEGIGPRKFRKEFHRVQFNPDSQQDEYIGSITTTSNGQIWRQI